MDFLKGLGSALGGVTNLLSGGALFDAAGSALGLPPVVTNAIKTAVGAATGNVMLAADGAMGLAQELSKNPPAVTEYKLARDECRAGEGYAKPKSREHGEASPVETGGSHEARPVTGGSQLDPKMVDYLDALQKLDQNFNMLDATDGKLDGSVSLEDLKRIANDARVSPGLRDAARFLVDNPGYFERLDTAILVGGALGQLVKGVRNDDRINLNGIRSELLKVKADFAQYGRPERPGSSSPTTPPVGGTRPEEPTKPPPSTGGSASSSVKGIINDPSMSLEEKLEAILMALTERMDNDILETMDDLATAQDRQSGIKNGKGDEKALADAQRDIDRIQMRLQKLVEKRKMMFEMMSTLSMKFNEMAKTALSNMRSA